MSVLNAFLNAWTDYDEIRCVYLSGSLDYLDSQLDAVGLTQEMLKGVF